MAVYQLREAQKVGEFNQLEKNPSSAYRTDPLYQVAFCVWHNPRFSAQLTNLTKSTSFDNPGDTELILYRYTHRTMIIPHYWQ